MQTLPLVPDTLTVNEAVRLFPATLPVFRQAGIETCCGGGIAIAEAAARHGADRDALLAALEEAARSEP